MAENEKNVEKKPAKKNKVSFGEKVKRFFRNNKSELKKIVWPTKEETFKNTVLVLVAVIVVGAVVAVLDLGVSKGIIGLSTLFTA